MRPRRYDLDVPTGTGAGVGKPCIELNDKWVQIGGTFSAVSLDVEVTLNDVDWEKVNGTTPITAKTIIQVLPLATQIRINVGSKTGTVTATLVATYFANDG